MTPSALVETYPSGQCPSFNALVTPAAPDGHLWVGTAPVPQSVAAASPRPKNYPEVGTAQSSRFSAALGVSFSVPAGHNMAAVEPSSAYSPAATAVFAAP